MGQLTLQKLLELSGDQNTAVGVPGDHKVEAWHCKASFTPSTPFGVAVRGCRLGLRSHQGRSPANKEERRATCDAEMLAKLQDHSRVDLKATTHQAATGAAGPQAHRSWSALPRKVSADRPAQIPSPTVNACQPVPSPTSRHSQPMQPVTVSASLEQHHNWSPKPPVTAGLLVSRICRDTAALFPAKVSKEPLWQRRLPLPLGQPVQSSRAPAHPTEAPLFSARSLPVKEQLTSLEKVTVSSPLVSALQHQLRGSAQLGCEFDDDLDSESSSSAEASAADVAQSVGLSCSTAGEECDDYTSMEANQAMTDGSSSTGDTDLVGRLLTDKGKPLPLLTQPLMGTAPTVAFVGFQPDAGDANLTPLRYFLLDSRECGACTMRYMCTAACRCLLCNWCGCMMHVPC